MDPLRYGSWGLLRTGRCGQGHRFSLLRSLFVKNQNGCSLPPVPLLPSVIFTPLLPACSWPHVVPWYPFPEAPRASTGVGNLSVTCHIVSASSFAGWIVSVAATPLCD